MILSSSRLDEPATRIGGATLWRRPKRRQSDLQWQGYVFILPTLLGLGIFSLWPIFQTLYFSFTTWGAFGGHKWSGITNYRHAFSDAELVQAAVNTLIYSGI